MSIQFSPVIAAQKRGGGAFAVKVFDLDELHGAASPVAVFDDFRVRGQPFPPHPHAGFSAVTYVFEDSQGALRSRDSLGNDVLVGPGGVVWTLAGSGVLHHEVPAQDDRELHGLQLFVNLSAENKLAAPRMLTLAKGDAPEWQNEAGDCVRVVVGSYGGVASPLAPVEPFDLLDVRLQREIAFSLAKPRRALIYVVDGEALVRATGRTATVPAGFLVALAGEGRATLEAVRSSHVIVLSGAALNEPVVTNGPFIMNDRSQIDAAVARYQAGQMGRLAPLSEL
jgi:hypothetical protein